MAKVPDGQKRSSRKPLLPPKPKKQYQKLKATLMQKRLREVLYRDPSALAPVKNMELFGLAAIDAHFSLLESRRHFEECMVILALQQTLGNQVAAAEKLHCSRTTIYRLLESFLNRMDVNHKRFRYAVQAPAKEAEA